MFHISIFDTVYELKEDKILKFLITITVYIKSHVCIGCPGTCNIQSVGTNVVFIESKEIYVN